MSEAKKIEFEPDFLITPYVLKKCKNLTPTDRDVYAVCYWYEKMKDGKCKAGNPSIAHFAGCTVRAVQNALQKLEKNGFVNIIYKDSTKQIREEIKTLCYYSKIEIKEEVNELPEWINKEAWMEWEKYRKEKRKTLTPATIKMQLKFLEANKDNHVEIINRSIKNGWTGLFVDSNIQRSKGAVI